MNDGGKRIGAGRKKNSLNRFSSEIFKRAKESGILPVDLMLELMRDEEQDIKLRLEAAKVPAPYIHPKLSSVSIELEHKELTHEEWLAKLN